MSVTYHVWQFKAAEKFQSKVNNEHPRTPSGVKFLMPILLILNKDL